MRDVQEQEGLIEFQRLDSTGVCILIRVPGE